MTRELVYTGFITLDGVADSPGGAAEGHRSGGWVARHEFVPEAFSLKGEELGETTALLFGRRSYEAFGAVWPQSEDHAAYRDLPKYVASTTIGEGDLVDGWGGTTILRSAEDVAALEETDGGAIFVPGSPSSPGTLRTQASSIATTSSSSRTSSARARASSAVRTATRPHCACGNRRRTPMVCSRWSTT